MSTIICKLNITKKENIYGLSSNFLCPLEHVERNPLEHNLLEHVERYPLEHVERNLKYRN